MAPNFSKNAILVGRVDSFCLVCETHLKSERDTNAHNSKPVHQKQLEAALYVEEFKAEGIKKIKNKYFCELCNKLLSVLARVRLHVTEQSHTDNKNTYSLKRAGNYIIAFEKVAISDQSWNGLNENSCAICNIEYDNEEIHKNQSTHILNVIQAQVEFDNDQNIYRKIDEYSFHCLTCNTVLGLNSLTSHFGGDKHKTLYQACCDAFNNISLNAQTDKLIDGSRTPKCELVNNEPNQKLQDEINLNETNKKEATKNEPIKSIQNDEVPGFISSDTTPTINNLNSAYKAKGKRSLYEENEEAICKALGCTDYITRDESNKVWCILCNDLMEYNSIASHKKGKHHQTILKLHKLRLQKMQNNNIISNHKEDTQVGNKIHADEILEKLNDFQNEDIQVNFETNTAFCKRCNTHIEFVCKVIENHVLEHNNKIDTDKILGKLNDFQKEEIQVNFESHTAFCKKCCTHIEFVCEAVETHILEHKKKEAKSKMFDLKVSDTNKTLFTSPVHIKRDKNKEEGNRNETLNKKETSSTKDVKKGEEEKLICEKTAKPSTVSSINDQENRNNAEIKEIESISTIQVSSPKPKKTKAVKLIKMPTKIFVQLLTVVENAMYKDVIINEKYCINFLCFYFLVQLRQDIFRCHLCEVSLQAPQLPRHAATPPHSLALDDTPVILNDNSEFIREIRPGCFHCGFCNCIETSWEDVEKHLKSSAHKEAKNSATWRKELYTPQVNRDIVERALSDSVFMDAFINEFL